ncbi:hypothetical protein PS645_03667 [Pseudomonas fluorescens]|uniref:DUF2790 domain-containing protein n=1 Tax=Pseudomonas fluorescens TaxID=294 RepID=A0A5E6UT97_PSEFL|nr:DUF2790 domain-containing protein [Pseudomonas fluorescens]VVN08583.1 hypothetical protein PS645_03667 [Pseudomonas fluorescens]
MKTHALLIAAALAGTVSVGASNASEDDSTGTPSYRYGMPLHVAKVISLTEPPTVECEVVSAHMKYIDSAGRPAQITYRKLSEACWLQN